MSRLVRLCTTTAAAAATAVCWFGGRGVSCFVPYHAGTSHLTIERKEMTGNCYLSATRRDWLESTASTILVVGVTTTTAKPEMARSAEGEVDYGKLQDLLGTPEKPQAYDPAAGGPRPKYLTEPTAEFKENEAKASEFKRIELAKKKDFTTYLQRVQDDPADADTLVADLDELRRQVKANGGLPSGITKEEVIKQVRRRKAKRFWPTPVDIAYKDLILEIGYQQSPNTEKDSENPL